ncbi:isochorismate synthase [Staphylococcus saccharolyticus]|uniref:isochorismate synthase n=1 Tax=Staphylococcus saccharolyticus TaxID=33028 RepID=UPI00102D795C|nr:isochorismate synthase [Staphylococcus saccharolyticus]MBL7572889.1 isochorismate synthase [Staphylococcus saccharolyticus]MBL7584175.1 isochorismate synthase [Staphylococcus saccharolyticus]MBL7638506.1 isochorismate synthase [Staphylococcus saccharolyticus]QRJ69243.1 isochorismate synthase [Staphylococcus saccharolyticus]TAA93423.1 isochorismate synthase [Staphylococcus saccharolyticus]
MDVNVKEDDIVDKIYESTKDWVSVEIEVDKSFEPSTLFHLTEQNAGDRFYMRLNDNYSSYFGYHAIQRFKNDFENKQSIFKDWEKLKDNIELIHPDSDYHHLRLCGGFQFSGHKSDDEWREYGLNHFILPKVLISSEGARTFITYTTERQDFDIEVFKDLITYLEHTEIDTSRDSLGEVTRMEDIYKDDWRDLVNEAIDTIDESKKIVLARRRLIKFDKEINIPFILNQVLNNEKNSYIFLLESNQFVFFSQTPEQLIKVEDGVLSTKAVAGTIKRTHNEKVDEENIKAFLKDKKNLGEHRFVVESILSDIKPFVQDVEYNETPNILKNDHLYHLYTEIKANLNDESYIGLIDCLHPTPALGGYPKAEAIEFIENKEFGTRGLYGSPVGFIDVYGDCEFIVAIRSMLIKDCQATLFAGCGIVKNSDPDSEVAETAVKFSPMMNALGVDNND